MPTLYGGFGLGVVLFAGDKEGEGGWRYGPIEPLLMSAPPYGPGGGGGGGGIGSPQYPDDARFESKARRSAGTAMLAPFKGLNASECSRPLLQLPDR